MDPEAVSVDAAVRRGTVLNLIGRLAAAPAGILLVLLLVRELDPSVYGAWGILLGIHAMLLTVGNLGILMTVQRFLPEVHGKPAQRLLARAVSIRSAAVGALAGCVLLAREPLADLFGWDLQGHILVLFLLYALFAAGNQVLEAALQARLAQGRVNLFGAIAAWARLAGCAGSLRGGHGLEGVVWTYLLVELFLATVLGMGMGGLIIGVRRGNLDRERILPFAARSYGTALGNIALDRGMDVLLVGGMWSAAAAGGYEFAASVAGHLGQFLPVAMLVPVLTPALAGRLDRGEGPEAVTRAYRSAARVNFWSVLPMAAAGLALGGPAIRILTEGKYDAAVPLFHAWLGILLLRTMLQPLKVALVATERMDVMLRGVGIGVPVNLLLAFLWIPRWGGLGAAAATAAALVVMTGIQWTGARRAVPGLPSPWIGIAGPLGFAVLLWAGLAGARSWTVDLPRLVVAAVAGLAVCSVAWFAVARKSGT